MVGNSQTYTVVSTSPSALIRRRNEGAVYRDWYGYVVDSAPRTMVIGSLRSLRLRLFYPLGFTRRPPFSMAGIEPTNDILTGIILGACDPQWAVDSGVPLMASTYRHTDPMEIDRSILRIEKIA